MHTRPTYDELLEKVNRLEQEVTRLKKRLSAAAPNACPPYEDDGIQLNQLKDITEKRKTEAELRNSHDFIQALLQTIPNPVFYKDAQGRYTGCNKAFEAFTGLSEADVMGKTVFDIAPQELAEKYHEKDRLLLETPGRQQYEWKVCNHEGVQKDVIFNKASILDGHGGINGLVGIISDISERKGMERALKKSEARFRAFIKAIPDILFIFDEDGKYIEIFTSASELLFDDLQQLKGNYIKNVLPADVAKQHADVIQKTVETQKIQFFEYTLSVPKGDCWFESFTAPILDLDEEKRFVASSVRDVTHRKLAEKEISEKQKLATVMETAGAVCHELNQPLQIISGCCELLQGEPDLSPGLQRKIEIIVNATERMAKLNHGLMNITSYKTKSYLKSKIIDIKGSAESDA